MHFHLLNTYPPGLDPDSATDGLDALKPIRYNIWPFYIVINSNPDPLFVYTAALTTLMLGPSVLAMRLASALYGLLGFAATYLCLVELGRNSLHWPTRRLVAVLAVAALAASQPIALADRMGLRFITLLPVQMLSVWALARAARTQHARHWLLAGAVAGLTQYTYPSARVLPLLWGLVAAIRFLQERTRWRAIVWGLALFSAALCLALLPQLLWYAHQPQTFLARAGQTSFTQNPVYASAGALGVLSLKAAHYWEALSSTWLGQYNQIKEPLFARLFFYALGLGILAALVRRTWSAAFIVCGAAVMLLPDLISGDRDWPHELRLIGAYPFVAAIAGYGLATAWEAARRLPGVRRVATLALGAAVGLTMILEAREFFSLDLNQGKLFWSGNVWLRRIDYGVANRIVNSSERFLLPLASYSDPVVKYLTSRRVIELRSALDASGQWAPGVIPDGRVTVLLPNQDDGTPWAGEPDAPWVLISDRTAYILPALAEPGAWAAAAESPRPFFDLGVFSFVELGRSYETELRSWPAAPEPEPGLHVCFEPGMCLVGAAYDDWRLRTGSPLRVSLFWHVRRPIRDDYILFVHLLDRDGNAVAGVDDYPLSHGYRTYEWRSGETIVSHSTLQVPQELSAGQYALEVGFYLPMDVKRVGVDGSDADRAYLPHLKVSMPPITTRPAQAAQAEFGPIHLIGYDLSAESIAPGNEAYLTLYWRAGERLAADYTAYAHVQSNDVLVSQADVQPEQGRYPTSVWEAGEIVTTVHPIAIAAQAPAEPYRIFVGWYVYPSGERLVGAIDGQVTEDGRVEIGRWP